MPSPADLATTLRVDPPAKLTGLLAQLAETRRETVSAVLATIADRIEATAVVLGGSMAGDPPRFDGDIDLWVFVEEPAQAAVALKPVLANLPRVDLVHDGGFLLWFGRLLTIMSDDFAFGMDIGFVTARDAPNINTGPGAVLVWAAPGWDEVLETACARKQFVVFTATSPQYPPGGVSGTRHRSRYQAFDRSEEASLGVEVQPILHVMPTVRRGAALRPRGPLTLHRGARIVAAL